MHAPVHAGAEALGARRRQPTRSTHRPPATQATVETAAQLLWEALHGIASLRITLGDDPWFERLPLPQHVQRMVQVFTAGLLHGT